MLGKKRDDIRRKDGDLQIYVGKNSHTIIRWDTTKYQFCKSKRVSRPQKLTRWVLSLLNTVWCLSLQVSGYEIHLHIETLLCLQKKDCVLPYVSVILCR